MSLTKYPEGSVRELWTISYPLMLSSLSLLAMVFVDRLFLANYSEPAMSAAVTAGTTWWAMIGSLVILASMAEVFVAQYNGAKRYDRIGRPVWQMFWLAIGSALILIPIGIWGKYLIFQGTPNVELERTYFQWLSIFGPGWPVTAALSAFFVGRGKTRLVMIMSIVANGTNILLDWLMIPIWGVTGAALATSFGNLIQMAVFLPIFLSKANRERFGTHLFKFHWKEFKGCLKVGLPQSTLFFVETIGYGIFYMMIEHSGAQQIFVAGICQSVLILFFFIAEGVGRGASAVSGNFIGGSRHGDVFKVFRSGLKLHIIFFGIASLFFVVFPSLFTDLFLGLNGTYLSPEMHDVLRISLRITVFYLLFECIRWLISGILVSAGDTSFLLVVGVLTVPLALLIPSYLVIMYWDMGVVAAFTVSVLFSFVVSSCFLWRLLGLKWQKIQLIT